MSQYASTVYSTDTYHYRTSETTGSSERTDEELLSAHHSGSTHAFALLVQRHQERLWRALRRSGVPLEECPDLLQDTLLRIHRFSSSFKGESSVGTWMYRIAENVARSYFRTRACRPTIDPGDYHFTLQRHAGTLAHPEDSLLRLALEQEFQSLPREYISVLELCDLFDHSIADTAEKLNLPEGTVKSRRSRARALLRKKMQAVDF